MTFWPVICQNLLWCTFGLPSLFGQSFYLQRMSVKTDRSPPVQAVPASGTAKLTDNWQSCNRESKSTEDGRLSQECHGGLWRHRQTGRAPGVCCVFYVWFQPFYSLSLFLFPAELLPSTLIRTSGLLSYKSCLVGTGQGHHGSLRRLAYRLVAGWCNGCVCLEVAQDMLLQSRRW